MARNSDGEWVGVSLRGEDEALRDLDGLKPGVRLEVGSEPAMLVDGDDE